MSLTTGQPATCSPALPPLLPAALTMAGATIPIHTATDATDPDHANLPRSQQRSAPGGSHGLREIAEKALDYLTSG